MKIRVKGGIYPSKYLGKYDHGFQKLDESRQIFGKFSHEK
jgi:hypothetical protein